MYRCIFGGGDFMRRVTTAECNPRQACFLCFFWFEAACSLLCSSQNSTTQHAHSKGGAAFLLFKEFFWARVPADAPALPTQSCLSFQFEVNATVDRSVSLVHLNQLPIVVCGAKPQRAPQPNTITPCCYRSCLGGLHALLIIRLCVSRWPME